MMYRADRRSAIMRATSTARRVRRHMAAGEHFMAMATLQKRPDSFSLRQLSPALGAEVLGIDLRDPIDDALKQQLLDAWHQHLVLLLRDQTLDEDAQVRFAESFGTLAKTTSGR